jgi:hypothetical protein
LDAARGRLLVDIELEVGGTGAAVAEQLARRVMTSS